MDTLEMRRSGEWLSLLLVTMDLPGSLPNEQKSMKLFLPGRKNSLFQSTGITFVCFEPCICENQEALTA